MGPSGSEGPPGGPRAPAGPRVTYAFVCLAVLVPSLQYHMVTVGLADMITDLGTSLRWIGWVVTAFTVATASTQPVAGKLGDKYGSRVVFAAGLIGFASASLVCAVAPNVYVLIVARLFQGVAAGTVMPTAFALVAAAYPERRAQAVGLISSVVPIGTLVGPVLGGVIVELFGWRATFLINIPLGVTLGLAALILLPRAPKRSTTPIDLRGAALLAGLIVAFMYAVTELAADDPTPLLVLAPTVAVAVIVVLFVRHERLATAPIIDLDLLRDRVFATANFLNFMYGAALVGLFGFVPLYVQTRYEMSPSVSGLVLVPRAIAMVAVSAGAAFLLGRTGLRRPIGIGLVMMGLSSMMLSLGIRTPTILGVQLSDFMWVTFVVTFVGVSYGFIGPALNNVGLERAPDRVASIAGLRGTFRSVGGVAGTAFMVLVVSFAPNTARGIEIAFVGLGLVSLACLVLVRRLPEPGSETAQAPSTTSATRRI